MSAYVPVSTTQLFDYNTLQNGFLQNSDGTVNSSYGANSGYYLSAAMRVLPGAHMTWASPASAYAGSGSGLFYGSGGPFPSFEFFSDSELTQLVGVDGTPISPTQANNYTTTVPAGAIYARAQFLCNPSSLSSELEGGTIITDNPYVAPVDPTIVLSIPTHGISDGPFTVAATSNSLGAFTYSIVSGPAAINGSTITLSGMAGIVVVQVSQASAAGYNAHSMTTSFIVEVPLGYTSVSASRLRDASGKPVTNATIYFSPVDSTGKALSFRAGGDQPFNVIGSAVSTAVTNGTFYIILADTSLANPENVGYAITLVDNLSGESLPLYGFSCFQPSGNMVDFDNVAPDLPSLQTAQSGAAGPPGEAATIVVGSVTELAPGATPTVVNAGTSTNAVLDFGLPIEASGSSALSGKKMAIFGDSITAIFSNQWQNVVTSRLGLVQHFQDARPGRRIDQIFECYGAPSGGSISTNQGTVSTANGSYANNGTTGNTLAQDLNGCDYCLIYLGTNDQAIINGGVYVGSGGTFTGSLGATTDTSSSLTEHGFIKRAIETILNAAPTIRIILITLYQTSETGWLTAAQSQAICNAYVQEGAIYGCGVINLLTTSNICPLNQSVTLQSDGIHPSALGFSKFVGPTIAQGIAGLL